MSRFSWIDRVNQTHRPDPPPKSGKGSSTKAWEKYAAELGYEIPAGAGRDAIIEIVEAGPPPEKRRSSVPKVEGPVYNATWEAVEGADHLSDLDRPAVAVLLDLAKTIDGMDQRPSTAPLDNVTIPTFHRYAESLGLTPMARLKLNVKKPKGKSPLDKAREAWGGRAAG